MLTRNFTLLRRHKKRIKLCHEKMSQFILLAKYCKDDNTKKKYTGKASGTQMRNMKVLVGKVNVRLIYSSTDGLFDDVCS